MARIVIQIDGIDVTAATSTDPHDSTDGDVADLGLTSRMAHGAALDGGRAPSGPPGHSNDAARPRVESEPAADAGQAPSEPHPHPRK